MESKTPEDKPKIDMDKLCYEHHRNGKHCYKYSIPGFPILIVTGWSKEETFQKLQDLFDLHTTPSPNTLNDKKK